MASGLRIFLPSNQGNFSITGATEFATPTSAAMLKLSATLKLRLTQKLKTKKLSITNGAGIAILVP